MVHEERERVLKELQRAAEFARTYRFEMTGEYRALIERVEALPQNRSGADKSGAWRGSQADRQAFFDAFSPSRRT